MTILTRNKLDIFREALIALLHGLAFLPVLYFALDLNRVPGIRGYIVFFIFTQITAIVFTKWWHFFAAQAALILVFLFTLFPLADQPLPLLNWPIETWTTGREQWTLLLASELTEVPMLLLTTLLFVLITLLTQLAIHAKLAIPSFLTGFVYLMLVHTFSANRIMPEMIQLIGFGFVFISLMQLDTRTTWLHFMKSFILTSVFTFSLVSLSSWAVDRLRPTQEWVEVRSQAYQKELDERGVFEWINTYSSGFGYRRTGFGVDDSRLGGPLRQDYTPLFRAYTSDPHYWKVMHRTEYTGIGWETEEDELTRQVYSPYNAAFDFTVPSTQREQMVSSEYISSIPIQWIHDLNYIAYPYGWYDVKLDTEYNNYSLERYDSSEFYSLETESDDLTDYVVTYDNQFPSRFDEESLRRDDGWRETLPDLHAQQAADSPDIEDESLNYEEALSFWFEDELQLPPALPQRVIDLALELTEGLDNEYDKVRAIEHYLKVDGGYRYSLLEVENTPEGGDYVDHFLFDSRIGYCNNFSSAMTIMLRAVGIPARWSKGFTPGNQYVDELGDTFFQVNNSNAHSWTEVFFPSYGWVPFEPSPSFANPMTNPEPVATVSGETYTFENEDFIDLEETAVNDDASDLEEGDTGAEPDPLEGDDQEAALDAESADESSGEPIRWSLFIRLGILTALITLAFLVILRWKIVTQLSIGLIKHGLLSTQQAVSLVLWLFSFRQKRIAGQTIQLYLDQWKPFAPRNNTEIDNFTALADAVYYGPDDGDERITAHQKEILTNILLVLYDLPDLKRDPVPPHPLSGDFKNNFQL
ncbi:MAG: transglutaminase domain-containing protein [Alkalibacterium sp.]|nr:transglutaminase domain-containing protein [Alkalibacterium sp.]